MFGRNRFLLPERCRKESLGHKFGRRESIFREDTGDTRDAGTNALDEMHPCEHPENERIPGAAAVAEVGCDIRQQAAGVGDFEAVIVELDHNLGSRIKVVTVAEGIGQGFFDCVKRQFPDFLTRVEAVHDVFDGQVLFDPGRCVVVLCKKRSFESLRVDNVDILGAFEAYAMDDCVDESFSTGIGKEHRDSVGYFTLIGEEAEVGDEFLARCV